MRSLLHLLARLRIVHLCETRPLFTLQSRRSKCDFSQIKKKIQFSLALALSLSEKLETRPSSSRAFKTGCTRNPTRIWTFVKLPFLSGFPLKWRNRKYFCSLIYGSFTQNRHKLRSNISCESLQLWFRTVPICRSGILLYIE